MTRFFTASAAVSILMLGLASAALAMTGEHDNMAQAAYNSMQ